MSVARRPVPATVGILTFTSSIETVEATIRSVLDFAEIIVCDGGSTDGTRELAAALGCRVIDQTPEFLDGHGRLINEAGVQEQILAAASFDWVFLLDHDLPPRGRILERVINRLVWTRVGIPELVRTAREVRRIDHRQDDIHLVDEHLPALPDAHVSGIRRRQSKHIGGDAHSQRPERAAYEAELVTNHLRASAAAG